jgi:hypothetical protein
MTTIARKILSSFSTHGSRWQRWLFLLFAGGILVETFNSLYLYSFTSLKVFYMGMVLFHVLFGFVLSAVLIAYVASHLLTIRHRSHKRSVGTGLATVGAALICFGLGIYLTFAGVPRHNEWKLTAHIVSGLAILFLFGIHFKTVFPFRRTVGNKSPAPAWVRSAVRYSGLSLLAVLAALIMLYRTGPSSDRPVQAAVPETDTIYPEYSYDETENPFFPSLATTKSGGFIPADELGGSEACGESGCHRDIYDQWNASVHRNSSFNNPFYRRATVYMGERAGYPPTKFCGGCHDPLVIFPGNMDQAVDTKSPEANTGLSCIACHSIIRIRDLRGNGSYVIESPQPYPFVRTNQPLLRGLNRMLIRVKPGPHRATFLKPIHRTAEFCMVCHKVHIPEQVNLFHWIRGQDEYDNWQNSGVSGNAVGGWYDSAEKPKLCQDCHMPEIESSDMGQVGGKIHNHRFPGPNTAIPSINGDKAQLEADEKFLKDKRVSVDIVALKRGTGTETETCYLPLEKCAVRAGETVRVEVIVRNRGVGHTFPGGTNDSNEAWVEFEAEDAGGRSLVSSGALDEEGYVDPGAHFYRSVPIDRSSQPVNKRNVNDWISTVYSRVIKPGASDAVHYQLGIPGDARFPLTVRARVNYRKFNQWFSNWVFRGERSEGPTDARIDQYVDEGRWIFNEEKTTPRLPIVTMASADVQLGPRGENPGRTDVGTDESTRLERLNDYGIGLVIQKNYREAEKVFRIGLARDPENRLLRLNLARSNLSEGDLSGAAELLDILVFEFPKDPKIRYFHAEVLTKKGLYQGAIADLEEVARFYPYDRKVRNELARLYFLTDDNPRATEQVKLALQIDPENQGAYYTGLLIETAMGRDEAARKVERQYLRFKPDESVQSLIGPYRLQDPFASRELQSTHFH